MKLRKRERSSSAAFGFIAVPCTLILFTAPPASAATARFKVDVASMVAHRYDQGDEVNYVRFFEWDTGIPIVDLSDDLFLDWEWPDPNPQVNQDWLETGIISAPIYYVDAPGDPFYDALTSGNLGLWATFTDTDDAMFAIDFLSLEVELGEPANFEWKYGWPQWPALDPNNGYSNNLPLGFPIFDGEDLPLPGLPNVLPPGTTGTGFDETISSKALYVRIPEPSSLGLLAWSVLWFAARRPRPK